MSAIAACQPRSDPSVYIGILPALRRVPLILERRRVVLIDCSPGGFGVVVDFDGLGVEVVADQDAGEQVIDVAGRGGFVVRAADEGAGWVGDVVEAFGDGGGGGADP